MLNFVTNKSFKYACVAVLLCASFLNTTVAFSSSMAVANDYAFSAQIRHAVENDNREWLANQIAFPLLYGSAKHPKHAKTKKEFFQHYNEIINPYVKKMISNYAQEDDFNLFKNSVGMMIGNGTIWFIETYDEKDPNKIKYAIITVNNTPLELP